MDSALIALYSQCSVQQLSVVLVGESVVKVSVSIRSAREQSLPDSSCYVNGTKYQTINLYRLEASEVNKYMRRRNKKQFEKRRER